MKPGLLNILIAIFVILGIVYCFQTTKLREGAATQGASNMFQIAGSKYESVAQFQPDPYDCLMSYLNPTASAAGFGGAGTDQWRRGLISIQTCRDSYNKPMFVLNLNSDFKNVVPVSLDIYQSLT